MCVRSAAAVVVVVAAVSTMSFGTVAQGPSSLLIRGGRLIDGSGGPERRADVRVEGDTIVAIDDTLAPRPGERVIEAANQVVAPGFIDTHSHADGGLDAAPGAATQVRQGITTTIVGQDGGSQLPIATFYESIARVRPAINYATTVGHGTARRLALGGDFQRVATLAEIAIMESLVDRGMRDGALGLSSGLEYDPGSFAEPGEVIALGKVVARYGGYYTSHVRDEEHQAIAFSKAYGLTAGSGSRDPYSNQNANTGSFGADPNELINADGILIGDRPYMFKVQGSYLLPRAITVSANWQLLTGKPVFTAVRTPSGLLRQGRINIQDVPKSEEVLRPPANKPLDLRVQKTFETNVLKFSAGVEIFNLLNEDSYYSVASTTIPSATTPPGYLQGVIFVPPRRAQLIVRVTY